MKIVHVVHNEKFIAPFYHFTMENFSPDEHFFIWFPGVSEEQCSIPDGNNILKIPKEYINIKNIFKLSKMIKSKLKYADKIIVHSLIKQNLVQYLYLNRSLLRKCYWVVWGADLYNRFNQNHSSLRSRLKQGCKRHINNYVKKNIGWALTYIEGDFDLVKKYYKSKANHLNCLMYQSNCFNYIKIHEKTDFQKVILVGNSADPENNHEEVFRNLKELELINCKIICPLSYGNEDYKEKISNLGKHFFGSNFEPILNFMSFEKYIELLSNVDIAIFAHNRQQAMGNIITLLGLGKTVFIKSEITPYRLFTTMGIKIGDANNLILKKFNTNELSENIQIIQKNFNTDVLKEHWENIYK